LSEGFFLKETWISRLQIAMLTAFSTTKELRSCHKQQQACTLVVWFFFRARELARPLPSLSHRRQQRKKRNPSFLRSSLGLFVVYEPYPNSHTIKIYDYVYMNERKYELVHTLFVFSFCLKEYAKKKILFSKRCPFFGG
jgi:hypothetical protein